MDKSDIEFIDLIDNEIERISNIEIPESEVGELGHPPTQGDIKLWFMKFLDPFCDTLHTKKDEITNSAISLQNQQFLKHLHDIWGEGFSHSRFFYYLTTKLVEHTMSIINKKPSEEIEANRALIIVAQYLHGRGSQQFLEVLTLTEHGFPDGAFARWRSLYELSVISSFIHKHGNAVAKSYIESAGKPHYYDWAKAADTELKDKRGKVRFSDIKKLGGYSDKWSNLYSAASQIIHPTAEMTYHRISVAPEQPSIIIGPSDTGLEYAAVNSAINLCQLSIPLMTMLNDTQTRCYPYVIEKWLNELWTCYKKTAESVYAEVRLSSATHGNEVYSPTEDC